MKSHLTIPYILFLGVILLASAHLSAQPICQIQRFSVYNGLAQRTVTAIVQDPKGFIWFSTWSGLNKFDGYTFKTYKAYPGDGCTLTSNRLSGIVANRHCDIWCLTYDDRVYLFDTRQEKFLDVLLPFEEKHGTKYTVHDVYALTKGISWIVCEGCAFRVDEERFAQEPDAEGSITYYDTAGPNLLPGKEIRKVRQDSEGDEWVFTDKGTRIIGRKDNTFNIRFKIDNEDNGKLYLISQDNRLMVYNFESKQMRQIDLPHNYSGLYALSVIGRDSIAVGTDRGLIIYYARQGTFHQVDIQTGQAEVRKIFKDSHGELWIFSDVTGVMRYNPTTQERQYYRTPPQDMPRAERMSRDIIFEDGQGTLWMVPHNGCLSYYDRSDKQLKPYYSDYNDAESKFTPVILYYYLDNQKNLWFANAFEMGKMSFFPNACELIPFDYGFETRAFLVDKDNCLWAANKKGIIRLFNPDGSLRGYLDAQGNITRQASVFGRNIYCFLEDDRGDIWMGSKWDGVFHLHKEGDKRFTMHQYVHSDSDPYSLSNNSVYSICQDSRKRIWIGTYGGGVNLLQRSANGEVRFVHSGNDLKGYPHSQCAKTRIIREIGQTLLVGTTEGLVTFANDFSRPEGIRFFRNIRMPKVASSLSCNDVTYIYTDRQQKSYVLTFTGGINQIVSEDLLTDSIRFKSYTKRDGLPSDQMLSMIEDANNELWTISENGLTRFDPAVRPFDSYGEEHFQNQIYFSEAIPVMYEGQIILGTETGVLRMNPDKLNKSTYAPPIVLTGIRIQGVERHIDIDNLKVLKLKPDERNVAFEFAALDYIDPAAISYAYRLKGLEEAWNEVGNNRRASYINLPPGEYELEIRSTNSDRIGTDNVRTLSIDVIPTFWETGWAILLYIFLFVLSTAIIVYIILYIYRLRHRINLEQQLTNIKLRFFTDISHELRTPLTLITSPVSEVLEHEPLSPNARKHLTLVHKNTERMLRLINQILDFRKIENKKMKLLLEKTEVIGLVKRVMDNFRLMAEERHIDYRLETDTESLYAWTDQDKVEKIIFNLLSNAFKYTPDNKAITVSVRTEGGKLHVSVRDEGIGISQKAQQTLFQRFETLVHRNILQPSSGIGLSLVKELIELHQGSIQVNSEPGKGSEFIVCLPLDQKAYEGNKNTEFVLNDGTKEAAPVTENEKANAPTIAVETADRQATAPEAADKEATDGTEASDGETSSEAPISILIVEDNMELREFLDNILSGSYRVIEATNGQEGLELALQHVPDLIISDIMMPVMDGLDMVKAIKENRDICHIPIILLSAKSSLDDRINGLEQGIDDYITKPFSSTYLKTRIKALLEQRRLLQELYLQRWMEAQDIQKESPAPAPLANAEPEKPQIASFDEQFARQVMEVMEKQMDNPELTIDEFAQELGMGRTVFYQKLKSIFGLAPVDFIREMRIKRAMQLLEIGEHNISTIAYMTGFNDPKYFSKCFKKKYGITPSEFQAQRKEENHI
ncbi:MAG: response regulator [Bacteroides sp.]|nr:response regulator [Bacteroides sp.]